MSPLYFVFSTFNIDTSYLEYYFKSFYWHEFMYQNGDSGARSDRFSISKALFLEMKLFKPDSKLEQKKIGHFLDLINKTIDLEQRKLQRYKKVKIMLLQNIFADNIARPKLRFNGFTDEWVQCKLGDIAKLNTTKNRDSKYNLVLTNSAKFGVLAQEDYFDRDIVNKDNLSNYYIVNPNDFSYNPRISTLAPYGPINRNKLGITGIMSPLYFVFSTFNVDTSYLEYYFKSFYWHKFMYQNGDSGARSDRFSISKVLFLEMKLFKPDSKLEQKKIGQFLDLINKTIDLEQDKLDKLTNLKQFLLQKLFV